MVPDICLRTWQTGDKTCGYPELEYFETKPRTAICFSGGSTRAYVAALGQLRGLTELGLISKVDYISSVSGSAWLTVPYTYYQKNNGLEDQDLLGNQLKPRLLTLEYLSGRQVGTFALPPTQDFFRVLQAAHIDSRIPENEVWTHAVGKTFLKPYGLFDEHLRVGFTWNRLSEHDFYQRNPWLEKRLIHCVSQDRTRPYLLVHATLNMEESSDTENGSVHRVGFEFSPLASGSPEMLTFSNQKSVPSRVGGGFVENFGIGSAAPSMRPGERGVVKVSCPERVLTLADVTGASSAFSAKERDSSHYPSLTYWPVSGESNEVASTVRLSDGGDIENYGVIPVLRRKIVSIVVFINTMWPLSLDKFSEIWFEEDNDKQRHVDPFLAPLFGLGDSRFSQNHVFLQEDFEPLIHDFQDAKRAGCPLVSRRRHRVVHNQWWGVSGGWTAQVCWVYNDSVSAWVNELSSDVRAIVGAGRQAVPSGPVQYFPHYKTRGQNPGALIRLTPVQVNLLSHFTCWVVLESSTDLKAVLS
tara:strand:- start:2564 stop:4144 length:1581 start_codon:yes stop_codon:yes gene_type:complete